MLREFLAGERDLFNFRRGDFHNPVHGESVYQLYTFLEVLVDFKNISIFHILDSLRSVFFFYNSEPVTLFLAAFS